MTGVQTCALPIFNKTDLLATPPGLDLADSRVVRVLATSCATGAGISAFKAALTEVAVAKLGPVGSEMQRLMKDPAHVDAILRSGAERARAIADPILADVYKTVGFLKP